MTSNDMTAVLVADLGGTQTRAAVIDREGTLHSRVAHPSSEGDPSTLTSTMREAREEAGLDVSGAVVGVPGPVSYIEGRSLRLPNLPQWEGHVAAQAIADDLGLAVLLANDADLAALGEHRFGAGRDTLDMVYVTISTGVGAGVVLNGRLLHGQRSVAEIGHTLIDFEGGRTVEELGSGTALEGLTGLDGAEVTRRAQAGDADALAAFARVTSAFAAGVLNLVMLYMPQRVVIGGGVSQAGTLVLDPVRALLEERGPSMAIVPEVVRASGGDDVGLLGGLALWLDRDAAEGTERIEAAQPRPRA
ncbi:MAG: ROK family protein [Dehalococcoidia bacterium]